MANAKETLAYIGSALNGITAEDNADRAKVIAPAFAVAVISALTWRKTEADNPLLVFEAFWAIEAYRQMVISLVRGRRERRMVKTRT